jgi:RimJ/RimL family protein N-acetyltransferase
MLTTARLTLRRFQPQDAESVANLIGDPQVRRYFFRTRDRAESDAWLVRDQAHWDRHGFGMWAVELAADAAFIGFVGLARVGLELPFAPAVKVAWTLAQPFWGRGYAPEAARAAMTDGFGRLGLREIVALTAVQNAPSRRVMEKLGMTRDPAADFDHPAAPAGHVLARHVLYRMVCPRVPGMEDEDALR